MRQDLFDTQATPSFNLSKGVSGRYITNEDGRIELVVVVDMDTSAELLRRAWFEINNAREKVQLLQGTDKDQALTPLRMKYANMKGYGGFSYEEIAMDINYTCLVKLCQASFELKDVLTKGYLQSLVEFYWPLKAVRFKDEAILYWLQTGFKEILAGKAPWTLQAGPVGKQRVRRSNLQFRREQRGEKSPAYQHSNNALIDLKKSSNSLDHRAQALAYSLLTKEPGEGGFEVLMEAYMRYSDTTEEDSGRD